MKKMILIIIALLLPFMVCGCEFSDEEDDYDVNDAHINFRYIKINRDYGFKYSIDEYYYVKCLNYGYLFDDSEYDNSVIALTGIGDYDHYLYKSNNDTRGKIYYGLYESYQTFVSFYEMWVKDDLLVPDEDDNILVTKVEVTYVPDTKTITEYESKPFDELFEEVADVSFIWDEADTTGPKVDAYFGYIKIQFYSECYQQTFTIMTKLYLGNDDNVYMRKGIERFNESYQKWYLLKPSCINKPSYNE